MFFDNPALYEHLDAVAGTWHPQVPGAVGRRWSEGICAAAWRVLVATEPDNVYSHNFPCPAPVTDKGSPTPRSVGLTDWSVRALAATRPTGSCAVRSTRS